jgi:hypothetical protein
MACDFAIVCCGINGQVGSMGESDLSAQVGTGIILSATGNGSFWVVLGNYPGLKVQSAL